MNETLSASETTGKRVVLARYRDGGIMAECLEVLSQHQIPYRTATTAPIFDLMSVGSAGANNEAMVLVEEAHLASARAALLADARATVQTSPPTPDDFLATQETCFLQQMLMEAEGWSCYDLATAEYLLRQRNATVPTVSYPDPSTPPKDYPPVRAKWHIILLTVLLTGGLMGVITGWSLVFSRQHGKGSPYHYDEFSRNLGLAIFILTMIAWGFSIALCWSTIVDLTGIPDGPDYHYHQE